MDEPSRRYFERVFGCKAFSCYGANEVGLIAAECTATRGLHVNADSLVVEVLKDGRPVSPGEQGEVVVTGLLNNAMPVIRYRLGDLGIPSDEICSCGRTLPLLNSVEGRTIDQIRLRNGSAISPKRITAMMHSVESLPRAQLLQEELGLFTLRVFADDVQSDAGATEFIRLLKKEIGEDVTVNVNYETPDRLRAKFRPVISRLSDVKDQTWVKA